MNSIRHQLFVALISTLTLVGCVAGVGVYYNALQAANTIFDYHLKQVAFPCAIMPLRPWTWLGVMTTTPSKIWSFKFGTTPGITCITRIRGDRRGST